MTLWPLHKIISLVIKTTWGRYHQIITGFYDFVMALFHTLNVCSGERVTDSFLSCHFLEDSPYKYEQYGLINGDVRECVTLRHYDETWAHKFVAAAGDDALVIESTRPLYYLCRRVYIAFHFLAQSDLLWSPFFDAKFILHDVTKLELNLLNRIAILKFEIVK